MVDNHDDKANAKHRIEIALIAMRLFPDNGLYNDPFISYQDGFLSKRKLIELIANELTSE